MAKVFVIILTHTGTPDLRACTLECVQSIQRTAPEAHILISEGHKLNTYELPGVAFMRQRCADGSVFSYNSECAYAVSELIANKKVEATDWIVLAHNDTIFRAGWYDALLQCEAGAAQFCVVNNHLHNGVADKAIKFDEDGAAFALRAGVVHVARVSAPHLLSVTFARATAEMFDALRWLNAAPQFLRGAEVYHKGSRTISKVPHKLNLNVL